MKRMIVGGFVALACMALVPVVGSVVPALPMVSNATSQGPPPLKLNYYRTDKKGPWCEDACDGVGPCCPLPPPGQ